MADELSMSPGAVRVAKSRVLQRLRDELGELIGGPKPSISSGVASKPRIA